MNKKNIRRCKIGVNFQGQSIDDSIQKGPSLQFIMLLKKVNFIFVNESGSMFICALTTSPIFKSHRCTTGAEGVVHLPQIASGATKLGTLM